MGRYDPSTRSEPAHYKEGPDVHPIWRGVGFLMMILIPGLSFVASLIVVQENNKQGWVPIPTEFLSKWVDPYLFIYIGLTILFSIVLYFVFQMFTFIIYRYFGPPRYGPLDAPPIDIKIKKRTGR